MTKKTPKEIFERRWEKDRSVEKQVYTFTKRRKCWDEGITFKKLKEKIEISLKKPYCEGRIYEAISLLNRYGEGLGIILRSSSNRNDEGKMEYRYYVPTTQEDIVNEERDLGSRESNIQLKQGNLEHHRKITIPQEIKIEAIRNEN